MSAKKLMVALVAGVLGAFALVAPASAGLTLNHHNETTLRD
jgi:hypothetical protein